MSINLVIVSGNVGKDAELRTISDNKHVCNFSIATNEGWYDKSGALQTRTDWHNIVVWGKLAEYAAKVALKGRGLIIIGKQQTREWVDKDGVTRRTTEIIANTIQCPNLSVRNTQEADSYEVEHEEEQEFEDETPAPKTRVPISAKQNSQRPSQPAKQSAPSKSAVQKTVSKSKPSKDIPF